MTLTIDDYKNWGKILSRENMFVSMMHTVGWGIASLLSLIADACQDLLDASYKLLNFVESATIYKIFSKSEVKILMTVLMTISLLYMAFTMVLGNKQKPPIIMNLAALIFVLLAMPIFMKDATNLIIDAKDHILKTNSSVSQQIKANSIIDLRYVDGKGISNYTPNGSYLKPKEDYSTNGFSSDYSLVDYIDENETFESKEGLVTPDLFFSTVFVDKEGNAYVQEIKKKSFFGIFDMTSYTYRYKIDYLSMYISLIAVICAFFFTSFKTVQLLYELVLHHTIGVIVGSADLHGGQKVKKLIVSTIQIFATLFFTIISLKFFLLIQSYINTNLTGVGLLPRSILLLFVAYAVIDGANILQVLFGIDAGLKSSALATVAGVRMAMSGASKVKSGASKMVGGIGSAVGSIKDKATSKSKDDGTSNLKTDSGKSDDLKGSDKKDDVKGDNMSKDVGSESDEADANIDVNNDNKQDINNNINKEDTVEQHNDANDNSDLKADSSASGGEPNNIDDVGLKADNQLENNLEHAELGTIEATNNEDLAENKNDLNEDIDTNLDLTNKDNAPLDSPIESEITSPQHSAELQHSAEVEPNSNDKNLSSPQIQSLETNISKVKSITKRTEKHDDGQNKPNRNGNKEKK